MNQVATRPYRVPTPDQIEHVVRAIAAGHTLAASCALASVGYTTIRARIAKDETLAERIAEAQARFHGVVIRELNRRAIEGVEKAVYHKGEVVGTELKYSDRLLLKLAEQIPELNPSRKIETVGHVTHEHIHSIDPTVLAAMNPSARIDARRAALLQNARNMSDEDKQSQLLAIATDASRDSIPFDVMTLARQLRIGKLADVVDVDSEEVDAETAAQLRELEDLV